MPSARVLYHNKASLEPRNPVSRALIVIGLAIAAV
jgi:hypothetical protein